MHTKFHYDRMNTKEKKIFFFHQKGSFEIKRYIFEHTSEQEAELKDKCLRHIRKCRNFERILKDESYFN